MVFQRYPERHPFTPNSAFSGAGKLGQQISPLSEVIKQAQHQADLLAQIRKQLGVETNSEILQALSNRLDDYLSARLDSAVASS